uniref:Uncharacterized protein n=1 Tax=Physcomitrium patens TaxID=3218 RepID=A0A2K1IR66_PHYPA|nr:probable folate-biopterin transporter 7 [Physcomitrium patens]XP_024359101.1 probable folate-biopterin transporter 7 [Physcomitrium patens]XP_024359102.1 probable folate-biopterin transporter 7 [Physcomitrium patens]XP_024359103.1 probable folate-biopterin transporter 7 [Physcomitrium patens]PNR31773.1 hypothetical protein PHYPA_025896 [Physcomitrium patens]|eukprot:XP_024359100.1 probable folate-biopterin transporter 7 [Physcomitrella patens]
MGTITRLSKIYGGSFLSLVSLCYFLQSFRSFPWMAMTFWYKDNLKVDPGTMQFLMSTTMLPMVAKPVYGIISDSVYIKGAHRIPYLVLAGGLQLFAWTAIALFSGVSSAASMLTAFLTITNLGGAISEVVQDAMVAEAGKNKAGAQPDLYFSSHNPILLTLHVSERSFGLGSVRDTDDNPELKQFQGRKDVGSAMWDQMAKLKEALQKPALHRPLLWFLSSFALIPGLGSSMFFFQTEYLGLNASVLGLARLVGQVGLIFGSMLYNKALKGVPVRRLFVYVQILLSLCMLTDVVFVKRINLELGIPDKWFVLGASAFVEAIGQFKSLPFMVLLAQLCPSGSEASVFSFFSAASCLAGLLNGYLGVVLSSQLNISAKDFSGLPTGILISASCALLPILWIGLIPEEGKSAKETRTNSVEAKKAL